MKLILEEGTLNYIAMIVKILLLLSSGAASYKNARRTGCTFCKRIKVSSDTKQRIIAKKAKNIINTTGDTINNGVKKLT